MQSTNVQAQKARQRLGELLELAYYKNQAFRISRKDKAMGWLVGVEFMDAIGEMIEHIIKHQPSLADTLTILLDNDINTVIRHGTTEAQKGKFVPIENILKDSE